MRLDPFVRDYRQFMDELTAVLDSERTRFYLDTSLLMWLVRLGAEARAEFLAWCRGRPSNCVKVPIWAAHELHRHLVGQTLMKNVRSTVSDAEGKIDEFVRLAVERADEHVCRSAGFTSRASYAAELQQLFVKLKTVAKVVQNDSRLSDAADEVVNFVNDHLLQTDIKNIIEDIGQNGEFRYSHLMPPGYHDKKDKNRFGDVVIWEEILHDVGTASGDVKPYGVLISRDEKTDWVSSAPQISDGDRNPSKANRDLDHDVTRAHPLLVHEFKMRARGDDLYVVPPSFLASAIDYGARKAGRPNPVPAWMAAAHRPDLLDRLAGIQLTVPATRPDPAGQPTQPAAEVPSPASTPVPETPTIAALAALLAPEEVEAYMQAIPTEQADVVASWRARLLAKTLAPETYGRLLAELGLKGRSEVLSRLAATIETLHGELRPYELVRVILGATVPAYFDRYGEPLPYPNKDLASVALMLEIDPRLGPAFSELSRFLDAADVELPYVPGRGRPAVTWKIDAADSNGGLKTLRDIRICEESVLAEAPSDESPRSFSGLLHRDRAAGCTGQELRMLIADELLIPADRLSTDYDKRRYGWLPSAGLGSLDTASPGGISAIVMDDDDDRG